MSRPDTTSTDQEVVADDGAPLHVRCDGPPDAPALLLCNSLGTDHRLWDRQVPSWTHLRRVIRFDQRGHGLSGTGTTPYTLQRLGRDAVSVLDAVEVDRADVCGISLGGMVALWLAINVPDRVRRVVAADTAVRVGTEDGWRARAGLVREHGMVAVHDAVLDRFFSPGFRAAEGDEVARVGAMIVGCDAEGYAASCEALATADLGPEIGSVAAPVLVVVGTEDIATTPDDAAALAASVPDARVIELAGAGHLANVEASERFTQAVSDHLADPPADDAASGPGIVDRGGNS